MFEYFLLNILRHIGSIFGRLFYCIVTLFITIFASIFTSIKVVSAPYASSYDTISDTLSLEVEEAIKEWQATLERDLPQTDINVWQKREKQAQESGNYPLLLHASMARLTLLARVSPDSLSSSVAELEEKVNSSNDDMFKAMGHVALYRIYSDNIGALDSALEKAEIHKMEAIRNPSMLAKATDLTFAPIVCRGFDANVFNEDLLSVVGYEIKDFSTPHSYYDDKNRSAACIMALQSIKEDCSYYDRFSDTSERIQLLDSLLLLYGDLNVACEVAIERYYAMKDNKAFCEKDKAEFLDTAIARWGDYHRADVLRNEKATITNPSLTLILGEKVFLPNRERTLQLKKIRNISDLTLKVYYIGANGDMGLDPSTLSVSDLDLIMCRFLSYSRPEYETFEDSITIKPLPSGVYLAEVTTTPSLDSRRIVFYVSDICPITQALPGNKERIVILNATTGQPVANAKVRLIWANDNKTLNLTCDKNGEILYDHDGQKADSIYAYTDEDKALPISRIGGSFRYYDNKQDVDNIQLFTDRKVYRPSQDIHIAALAYTTYRDGSMKAKPNSLVTITLRDANRKTLTEKQVTTDNYGKAETTFTLPSSTLNGKFSLSAGHNTTYIQVEEYKRPTFKIDVDTIRSAYKNGDTLHTTGHAMTFSGIPLRKCKVTYSVTRHSASWLKLLGSYSLANEESLTYPSYTLFSDTLFSDSCGCFPLTVPIILPSTPLSYSSPFFHFVIDIYVTNQQGETHYTSLSLPLGAKEKILSCNIAPQTLRNKDTTFTLFLYNASGIKLKEDVSYTIDNHETLHSYTDTPISLPKNLSSGKHTLTAFCNGDTLKKEFILFSLDDRKPPIQTDDWWYLSAEEFPLDNQVTLQVGSSQENLHLIYTIIAGEELLESGAFDTQNANSFTLLNRKFTYKETYGDGILLNYAWVKDGKYHTHQMAIRKPLKDHNILNVTATFRDYTTSPKNYYSCPYYSEHIKITVTKPLIPTKANNVSIIATLYDKSLDAIQPLSWDFNPSIFPSLPSTSWQNVRGFSLLRYSLSHQIDYLKTLDFSPSYFDPTLIPILNKDFGIMLLSNFDATQNNVEEEETLKGVQTTSNGTQVLCNSYITPTIPPSQMRTNFNETAFFICDETIDSEGSLTLDFTLPESLTTWKLLCFAFTQDMSYGMFQTELTVKKDFFITLTPPRFIRLQDQTQLDALLTNTTSNPITGTVQFELTDTVTDTVLYCEQRPFTIDANSSENIPFSFTLPHGLFDSLYPTSDSVASIKCVISAFNDTYSDGESHYITITDNCETITEAIPFVLTDKGKCSIDTSSILSKGTDDITYSLQYYNSPEWLMLQALPSMSVPKSENAIDLATAYYANAIAYKLLNESFDAKDSLSLCLSSDSSLLVQYLDSSLICDKQIEIARKLKALQRQDGSWSWCQGMQGNVKITTEIAQMFVRLISMTGEDSLIGDMIESALYYLDSVMTSYVGELQRSSRHNTLNEVAIKYLYIYTLYGQNCDSSTIDYLLSVLKESRKYLCIGDLALAAIIFNDQGYYLLSDSIVRTLKDYTVYSPEKGRYYDTNRAILSCFDYRISTQVSVIEALQRITPCDTTFIEEMLFWLLHEKRLQSWDTPINSVNAVYSYVTANAKSVVSWGAIYATYKYRFCLDTLQLSSCIESSNNSFSLRREVIASDSVLHIGDIVTVRITVESYNDYDFVEICDNRATCFEPVSQVSGYSFGYYCMIGDVATHYFFDRMPKGRHVIESSYYVCQGGIYCTGSCTIECSYAPEYCATVFPLTVECKR